MDMRILVFIFLIAGILACQQHSRESERIALGDLYVELAALEKSCVNVLTDIDETSLDAIDTMFLVTQDTIWIDLKSGYAESEKRLIHLSNLIDQEVRQLNLLRESLNKRHLNKEDFRIFFEKEKQNVLNLNIQIKEEVTFRNELKVLKFKLRKKNQS